MYRMLGVTETRKAESATKMSRQAELELFFGRDSPFSQHHRCRFVVDGMVFTSAEKYMMFKKAEVFNDEEIKMKVLKSDNPVDIKHYGREIESFDIMVWMKHAVDVVKTANMAKFSQNASLKTALVNTYPKELVEASPSDTRWGIGLSKSDPRAWNKAKWRGRNLLGGVLTNVRDALMISEGLIQEPTLPDVPADQTDVEKEMKDKEQWGKRSHSKERNVRFSFFDGAESPFSDDHWRKFTVRGKSFMCVNQYMFYSKAEFFRDERKMKDVMSVNTADELWRKGNRVNNYNGKHWYDASYDIYWEGIEAKFSQNEDLKKALIASSPNVILKVEARDIQRIVNGGQRLLRDWGFKEKHWKEKRLEELRDKIISEIDPQSRGGDTSDSSIPYNNTPGGHYSKMESTMESDREAKRESKTDYNTDFKVESNSESKREFNADFKVESKNESKRQYGKDSKVESKIGPKDESKNEHKITKRMKYHADDSSDRDRGLSGGKNKEITISNLNLKQSKKRKKDSKRNERLTIFRDSPTKERNLLDSVDFSHVLGYENDSVFSPTFVRKFEVGGKNFGSLEQYMCYAKAELFKDEDGRQKALAMMPSHNSDTFMVAKFDFKTWTKHKDEIYKRGLEAKFSQHDDLMSELVNSHPRAIFKRDTSMKPKDYRKNINDDKFKKKFWKDFHLMELREQYVRQGWVCNQPNLEATHRKSSTISSGAGDVVTSSMDTASSTDLNSQQYGPEVPDDMPTTSGILEPDEEYGPELPVEMMVDTATESGPGNSQKEADKVLVKGVAYTEPATCSGVGRNILDPSPIDVPDASTTTEAVPMSNAEPITSRECGPNIQYITPTDDTDDSTTTTTEPVPMSGEKVMGGDSEANNAENRTDPVADYHRTDKDVSSDSENVVDTEDSSMDETCSKRKLETSHERNVRSKVSEDCPKDAAVDPEHQGILENNLSEVSIADDSATGEEPETTSNHESIIGNKED